MKRVLLASASLAVMLTSANAMAAEIDPIATGSVKLTTDDAMTYNSSVPSFNFDGYEGNTGLNGAQGKVTFADGFQSGTLSGHGVYGQDGIIEVGTVDIQSGTINASGQGALINADTGTLTMSNGQVNLSNQAQMIIGNRTGSMTLSGGEVNLSDGGVLRASSDEGVDIPNSNKATIAASGAVINVSGSGNVLASRDTTVNGGEFNINNGTLNLVGDGERKTNDYITFDSDVAKATKGDFNVTGGKFAMTDSTLNANQVAVALSGGQSDFNGNNIVNGDLNISGGTVTNHGDLTLNGVTTVDNATLERDLDKTTSVTMKDATLTNGGIIAADHMTVNGTVSLSGQKSGGVSTWRDGSDLVADRTMTITSGAEVTVGNQGILTVGFNKGASTADQKMDINGKVSVENGGYIHAASNSTTGDKSAVNINEGGSLDLQSGSNLISAETNVNGGDVTIAGNVNFYKNSKVNGLDGAPVVNALAAENGAFNINSGTVTLGTGTDITNTDVDINVNNGGNLVVADASTVSGALNLAGGTIENNAALTATVDQTAGTFNANTGSTLSELAMSGGTFNVVDNSTLTNATIAGGSFNVAEGKTLTSTTLNLNGGELNNAGTIGDVTQTAGALNMADASTAGTIAISGGDLNINGDATVTAANATDGAAINLGTNTLNGNVSLDEKSVLNVDVNNEVQGKITGALTGASNGEETSTVNLNIANGTDISGGIQLANSSSNIEIAANNLYKDAAIDNLGKITAEKKTAGEVASGLSSQGVNANAAAVLGAVAFGGTGTLTGDAIADAMAADLQAAGNSGVANAAQQAENMMPMAGSVANNVSTENATQIMNVVNNELNNFGNADGRASGDSFNKVTAWIKGLFNKADLERNSKGSGYKADNDGVALGIDKQVTDETRIGIGYAYTSTDIKGGGKKTDVDTHTAILYGQYKPSDVYFNGIATYGWSDYDAKSSAYGYGLKSKYDVDIIGLQAMAGYDMGAFAPEAGLRYFNVKQDSHRDNAGQEIHKNRSDTLTAVAGVSYHEDFCMDNGWILKPSARLAATYDLLSDRGNSVVTLANGAGYVVDGRRLDRFGVEVGAGIAAEISDSVELGISYEGRFRDDYTDNTGMLEAKYKF